MYDIALHFVYNSCMVYLSVLSDKLFSLDELNQVMEDFMFGLSETSSIPSLLLCSVFQSADNHRLLQNGKAIP